MPVLGCNFSQAWPLGKANGSSAGANGLRCDQGLAWIARNPAFGN
jgi:hypothetical protein